MKISSACLVLLSSSLTVSSAWMPKHRPMSSSFLTTTTEPRSSPLVSLSSTSAQSEKSLTAAAATPTATSSSLSPEFAQALEMAQAKLKGSIPEEMQDKMLPPLSHFLNEYMVASQDSFLAGNTEACRPDKVAERILTAIAYGQTYGMGKNKFTFDVKHKALRGNPETENGNKIDFYRYGCEFFKTVMNLNDSLVLGVDNLARIQAQVDAGENVVLFANHQSEADPQCVSAGLEMLGYGRLAEDTIYVAGHKVTTDPLAVPFSMGRNLLCIHSKKHIDADPATKPIKQKQNLKAMNGLLEAFKQGGTVLWVAPSGGRDRRDLEKGEVPIAPFDTKTIDIFRLMGNKSKVPTHYYPLAMVTYDLCPPPDFIVPGVGEPRNVRYVPIGLNFGDELESVGGLEQRQTFSKNAFEQCEAGYKELLEKMAKK